MTRLRFATLLFAFLLIFSACGEYLPIEPSVSVSIGEYTLPETYAVTDEVPDELTDAVTSPPETEPEETYNAADIKEMQASEIFALARELCGRYYAFTRTSQTKTKIEIAGEVTERESKSELALKDGNAVFRRSSADGDEEYHLVDSFLCFRGSLGNYRVGGISASAFVDLFSEQMPAGAFEEGEAQHRTSEIVLNFEKLSAQGVSYLREMLAISDETVMDIKKSSMEVHTDLQGNMNFAAVELKLTLYSDKEELMKLDLCSEMHQSSIVGIIDLKSPNIADYALFPNLETIAYYENAVPQISVFTSNRDAFEFTDLRATKIESESLSLVQNTSTDYAYASRIGLSIDKRFDVNDGSGMHSLLTHFNKRRAFSRIDGGNIFVDTTVTKDNQFILLFRPFDNIFFTLSDCKSADIVKDGKITLHLKDDVTRRIAEQILLSSGIAADDMRITKVNRAVTYIKLDESGKLASVGYEFSLNLTASGKSYTLSQSGDITVKSHNSAKVKVIYIDIPEEEEE